MESPMKLSTTVRNRPGLTMNDERRQTYPIDGVHIDVIELPGKRMTNRHKLCSVR
eukprot:m.144291 g.144291  ORF g.144291 m.144291 type:complete len:55 (+) comp17709_c0_seq3:339-503(+)